MFPLTLALTRAARRAFCQASLAGQTSADRRGFGLSAALACAEQPAARMRAPEEGRTVGCAGGKEGVPCTRELGLPLPRVKSPPWHMNCVMTRWKEEPLKWSGLPLWPMPFSPVHRARKFCRAEGRGAQPGTAFGSGAQREEQSDDRRRVQRKGAAGRGCRVRYQTGVVRERAYPGGVPPQSWARRQHEASSRCGQPARHRWSCQSRRRECPWL